jgi:hypothetical protein
MVSAGADDRKNLTPQPAPRPTHCLTEKGGTFYLRAAYNAHMHCQEQVMKCAVLLYYDRLQCPLNVAMKI